jgi:hypothetical protein
MKASAADTAFFIAYFQRLTQALYRAFAAIFSTGPAAFGLPLVWFAALGPPTALFAIGFAATLADSVDQSLWIAQAHPAEAADWRLQLWEG